jgi:hypothetical protein
MINVTVIDVAVILENDGQLIGGQRRRILASIGVEFRDRHGINKLVGPRSASGHENVVFRGVARSGRPTAPVHPQTVRADMRAIVLGSLKTVDANVKFGHLRERFSN